MSELEMNERNSKELKQTKPYRKFELKTYKK